MSTVNNYVLELQILDIERDLPPVTGNQIVSDLSDFPRIRVQGVTPLMVSLFWPHCGGGALSLHFYCTLYLGLDIRWICLAYGLIHTDYRYPFLVGRV